MFLIFLLNNYTYIVFYCFISENLIEVFPLHSRNSYHVNIHKITTATYIGLKS